LQEIQRQKQQ